MLRFDVWLLHKVAIWRFRTADATRRVGNLSIDLEARVKALPLAQLEELGEALLDFGQMNDLVVWLDMNRSPA